MSDSSEALGDYIAEARYASTFHNVSASQFTKILVPSPPPNAGSHTFPIGDFPPPRRFSPGNRQYPSGRQHGSDFDLGAL